MTIEKHVKLKVKLNRDESGYCVDPIMDRVRHAARKDGYAGRAGFKEWAKENYNAKLKYGSRDWVGIKFETEEDMARFCLRFC